MDNFEKKKKEFSEKIDKLINDYEIFVNNVRPKHWRTTGTHFQSLRSMKNDIKHLTEITEEDMKNDWVREQLKSK